MLPVHSSNVGFVCTNVCIACIGSIPKELKNRSKQQILQLGGQEVTPGEMEPQGRPTSCSHHEHMIPFSRSRHTHPGDVWGTLTLGSESFGNLRVLVVHPTKA